MCHRFEPGQKRVLREFDAGQVAGPYPVIKVVAEVNYRLTMGRQKKLWAYQEHDIDTDDHSLDGLDCEMC